LTCEPSAATRLSVSGLKPADPANPTAVTISGEADEAMGAGVAVVAAGEVAVEARDDAVDFSPFP
jgi:hypothetical protein